MSIIIVGAGPNLGAAIARRFGREGLAVGLISRNAEKLQALVSDLADAGITADHAAADIRDAGALSAAVGELADRLGPVEVLEYAPLPAREFMKPILETTVDDAGRWSSASSARCCRPCSTRAAARSSSPPAVRRSIPIPCAPA